MVNHLPSFFKARPALGSSAESAYNLLVGRLRHDESGWQGQISVFVGYSLRSQRGSAHRSRWCGIDL